MYSLFRILGDPAFFVKKLEKREVLVIKAQF